MVSVKKTTIEPGFYEFRIHLKDGTILRHFEEVKVSTTLRADFANFVNINVYPVPVKEQMFAVDFDLDEPMTINMTVVNNVGVNYYTNSIRFDLGSRNKHVVRMSDPWPNGLYHAHFQFPSGSVQSRSFIVDMD